MAGGDSLRALLRLLLVLSWPAHGALNIAVLISEALPLKDLLSAAKTAGLSHFALFV